MATAQDVLNLARSQLGVSENPPGSNSGTPYHAWFGGCQGWQWCAIFVSWLFGNSDPALIHNLKSAYSGDFITVGTRYGEMILYPQPGCICVMDYGDGGITDHIGIVESVGAGKMVLIEGNHNNRVERVTRPLGGSTRFWYVLPKYNVMPKPKTQEDEVSTQSSAGRVNSFEGIYQIGIMDGRPWDVWAKAQNPTGNEITVDVAVTTNNMSKINAYPLAANQILEVQVGKGMGVKGNVLVTIEPGVPAVCTFDHRPRG